MNIKNIAILYGGKSSEREISLMTGNNVGETLKSLGHQVTYIDTKEKNDLKKLIEKDFDIAYLCLHGKGGEDGSIQGFLETINMPYTASGILSSALAINKAKTKNIYKLFNIPTPEFVNIRKDKDIPVENITKVIGEKAVIKAANEGSSIGLFHAQGKEEIKNSINKALEFDDDVVAEQHIKGREFTVATLEFPEKYHKNEKINFDGIVGALPVIEIIPKNEFYDFASKYDKGGSQHICPAEIDDKLAKQMQQIAIKAFKALDCAGIARTDFIVNEQGQPLALETNTLPGMTKTSLVPDAARAVGIEFEEVCSIILEDGLK